MTVVCKKCGRRHSGAICGIPAGVTLGFGAKLGSISNPQRSEHLIEGKPKQTRRSATVLNRLLKDAQGHLEKVNKMLKTFPADMPEYSDLLDREAKLSALINQLIGQIAVRESKI